jgi:hypothetical protein
MLAASTFIRTSSFFSDGTGISTYWSNNRLFCSIHLFSRKRMDVDSTWANSIYKDPKSCDMGPEITNWSSLIWTSITDLDAAILHIVFCSPFKETHYIPHNLYGSNHLRTQPWSQFICLHTHSRSWSNRLHDLPQPCISDKVNCSRKTWFYGSRC